MYKVSVIVATYGEDFWKKVKEPALLSAINQTIEVEVVNVHGDTLAQARNSGAEKAQGRKIVFLDGDDHLSENYCEEMLKVKADIVQPSTLGHYANGLSDAEPVLIPAKTSLLQGNWLVIGSMCTKKKFLDVGGFRELPAWEDYDLWVRMWKAGATIGMAPKAVYNISVRLQSRNDITQEQAGILWNQLQREYAVL